MSAELLEMSALEQSALIRRRALSALELTELYLDRIERLNPTLNVVVATHAERARAAARQLDGIAARRSTKDSLGPLFGVPTLIKDLDDVRFSRTRFGCRSFRWYVATSDGIATAPVRAAQMVILGKTATSELGLLPITETLLHGASRNPWNEGRTVGGSSGGAGGAVAARMASVVHGSDGAGSIRIPAALNGVFGYKPSRGFLLDPTGGTDPFGLSVLGPLARSVVDLAAMGELWRASRDGGPLVDALERPPQGARISVMLEPPFGEVPAPHLAAAQRAHEALSGLGHRVTHLPRIPATLDEFVPVYQFMFAQLPVPFKDALHPTTRWFIEEGEKQSAQAMRRRADDLSARVDAAWADADFLLTPTVATKTPRIGAFEGLPPAAHFDAVSPLGVFTAPFNLGGQPAVHLPLGHDDEGMPVGVQLVGRRGDDAAVLALAQQLADAAGAKADVPPIAERATRRPTR